jgi:benzoyl-CoA reductase/2-hydroxyglutaryl-CoA dehydratase subunit BcrC/BadD/HgdB
MRLKEWLGYKIHWLEIPYRRSWQSYFTSFEAYSKHHEYYQKDALVFYREQLRNVQSRLEEMYGFALTIERLKGAMQIVNRFRQIIRRLTHLIATTEQCLLPAVDQLLLHVCAMDGYGDLLETQDILEHMEQLLTCRERKGGVLPGETRHTPHILWMMPVLEMSLPSILEDAGARVVGWEMPHLTARDYEINGDPLSAMAEDYMHFPLLGDCQLRLNWLADYISRYRVDGIIYSSIWSCTQMPVQAGIVKDFLSNYNIPILILDCGSPGGMVSGQMRTRIEAFVENLS